MSIAQELHQDAVSGNGKGRLLPLPSEWHGVWDHGTALWTVGNDVDFFIELVRRFLMSCPRTLASITAHLADGELKAVEAGARNLKDLLGELAAEPARDAALELETIAREGDLAGARAACQALHQEIAELRPPLTRIGRLLTREEF